VRPDEALALLERELQAYLPARIVTRSMLDFAERDERDLVRGVITIIGLGESDFNNYLGAEATFGRLRLLLVGQLYLGAKALGVAVEDAEYAMIEEIKAFTRAGLVPGIDSFILNSYRQSGQIELPYGWVAADMELRTS
jgi:hypothetical protein